MNTATYREQAYDAAANLQWAEAARLYDLAISHYARPIVGAVAQLDIDYLTAERENCLLAAESTAKPPPPLFAHFSVTRLCGVNIKQPIKCYRGKSVLVEDPQQPGRVYRLDAQKFVNGDGQSRDSSWWIRRWDDKSERMAEAESNWQT